MIQLFISKKNQSRYLKQLDNVHCIAVTRSMRRCSVRVLSFHLFDFHCSMLKASSLSDDLQLKLN